ncbi:MAG: ATP-binding cassette domain-containing protein [Deltaproteobacteria bacterium]|nr:ATP-binding cassette domain-containing protein [Deltaproteobacteria bacterium]
MSKSGNEILIEVQDLKVYFPVLSGSVLKKKVGDIKAVDGVSFFVRRGETLGLVGESGSGKTTTGNAILQLDRPTDGRIFFEGENITGIGKEEIRKLRRRMQMIFQDPFSSLDPRMTVGDIIGEPLIAHGMAGDKGEYRRQVDELLTVVGLDPSMGNRYPHEFSGGQRQRVGIARALAVRPSFIVCDEPVSALDVSIQAQIINLLEDLQERFNLTYLFIAHDLAVVRHISDRIAVMYLGKFVEVASRIDLYHNPLHPYTHALLSAVPIANPGIEATREHIILKGEVPSPLHPPLGCPFHPRCIMAMDRCATEEPLMKEIAADHFVACHLCQDRPAII